MNAKMYSKRTCDGERCDEYRHFGKVFHVPGELEPIQPNVNVKLGKRGMDLPDVHLLALANNGRSLLDLVHDQTEPLSNLADAFLGCF